MRRIKNCVIAPLIIMLSACSSMNSNFDCPMQNGISCQSLDEVNASIDAGAIGISRTRMLIPQPVYLAPTYGDDKAYPSAIRLADKTTHVWIAPFVDTAGNFHAESDVYVVTNPSMWLGNPKSEIRGE